ncbi:hypothetical protein ACNHYB_02875 [Isoptericola jiangsuensis]|uniref:hypothetical protein n=1 Tax=Isoptericola jiangsuensis TaxID=548579 RepID=UPI003AACA703
MAAAFALWVALRRGPAAPHLAVLIAALTMIGAPSAPFDAAVLGLAPLGLMAVRLTWWAEHVGRRTRVETAALWHVARRDLTITAVTLAVGGAGWLASGFAVGGLVVLGAAALLTLATLLLRGSPS